MDRGGRATTAARATGEGGPRPAVCPGGVKVCWTPLPCLVKEKVEPVPYSLVHARLSNAKSDIDAAGIRPHVFRRDTQGASPTKAPPVVQTTASDPFGFNTLPAAPPGMCTRLACTAAYLSIAAALIEVMRIHRRSSLTPCTLIACSLWRRVSVRARGGLPAEPQRRGDEQDHSEAAGRQRSGCVLVYGCV